MSHIQNSSSEEKTWSNELMLVAVALRSICNKYPILIKVYALFTFLRGRTKVNQNELHNHAIATCGAPSLAEILGGTGIFEGSRNVFNSVRFLRRIRKVISYSTENVCSTQKKKGRLKLIACICKRKRSLIQGVFFNWASPLDWPPLTFLSVWIIFTSPDT